ncbi:GGDEF domain-containing protein [Pseudoalteromonas sp. A25]|nr:GGDEF domain-containing protein [Pseudoalteromonas sp. A25]
MLFLVLFLITFFKDLTLTKQYLKTELTHQAQNTATNLGLSIAPYINKDDFALAKTMAKAQFDSGYYTNLTFIGSDPELTFNYQFEPKSQHVPDWFVSLVQLTPPTISSEVSSGWHIAGTLSIQVHPGSAYLALYTEFKQTLTATLAVTTLLALILFFFLKAFNKLSRVLQRHTSSQDHLSAVSYSSWFNEFNVITAAFNRYVQQAQQLLSNKDKKIALLRQEVYSDELTGLSNRRALNRDFDAQFENIQKNHDQYYFGLITLSELRTINQSEGYSKGDDYIHRCAKLILDAIELHSDIKAYKLSGSEFAIFGKLSAKQAGFLIDQLRQSFSAFSIAQHGDLLCKPMLIKVRKNERIQALLMRIDAHISKEKHFGQVMPLLDETISGKTKDEWHDILSEYTSLIDIIEVATHFSDSLLDESLNAYEQIFDISIQPVINAAQHIEYQELFIRFKHNGEFLSTSDVFSMAERYGFVLSLERAVVSYILQKIKAIKLTPVAINISNCSLYDHAFNDWLFDILPEVQHQLPPLIFEVNESALVYSANVTRDFINRAKDHNIKITLDRFGTSFSSFQYIQNLRVDYVKIDGSLIKNCDHTDYRFFINTVTSLCHGLGIKVIAAHVETNDVSHLCHAMKIDGQQGLGVVPVSSYTDYIERKDGTVCHEASSARI